MCSAPSYRQFYNFYSSFLKENVCQGRARKARQAAHNCLACEIYFANYTKSINNASGKAACARLFAISFLTARVGGLGGVKVAAVAFFFFLPYIFRS